VAKSSPRAEAGGGSAGNTSRQATVAAGGSMGKTSPRASVVAVGPSEGTSSSRSTEPSGGSAGTPDVVASPQDAVAIAAGDASLGNAETPPPAGSPPMVSSPIPALNSDTREESCPIERKTVRR
jgi:hypothetical protein